MREPSPTVERATSDRGRDHFGQRIENVVRLRTGGLIRGLRVEVLDSSVVLTGCTTSFYNKQLATHAALGALRGQTLKNLIAVN